MRARYVYDPYGRRTRLNGDLEADFGFAGMFWAAESELAVTRFRAYDPELGRWLSRDPLPNAEVKEGANLYCYVRNNPAGAVDPLGLLCCRDKYEQMDTPLANTASLCDLQQASARQKCAEAQQAGDPIAAAFTCAREFGKANESCARLENFLTRAGLELAECFAKEGCLREPCPKPGPITGPYCYGPTIPQAIFIAYGVFLTGPQVAIDHACNNP